MADKQINKRTEYFKSLISGFPDDPGIYQFYDTDEKIIYIGKAKNLKKRVSSYFLLNQPNNKTRLLVKKISKITYIIVESEQDALLLENSLIKKYKPRYNILLKDDKSFPWICVKNESFPRVFLTRNPQRDGSQYFGPYTSVKMVRVILGLVKHLYKLRTCNYNLNNENIKTGKYKLCLEYHIGNCLAPCVGQQSESDYLASIIEIKKILKGNLSSVIEYLNILMIEASEKYDFEKAQLIKEKLELLKNYKSKSQIVSIKLNNIDVFSFLQKDDFAYVNYLRIANGSIIQSYNLELKSLLSESKEELLSFAIIEIKQKLSLHPKEIILPFPIKYSLDEVKITVPKRGEKKHLIDLSTRNAKCYMLESQKNNNSIKKKNSTTRKLNTLAKDLHISDLPVHIECFDNSNIQGTNPVASCVVFKNTLPSKKDYRHFNIKTVEGANDFASMQEVVYRRYSRLLKEKKSLPQLIVIDGGKGQLSFAYKALSILNLEKKISIIGIAKRLEEIYFPNDSIPLYLDKNSESLKIIQHLRNEAHRFAISFHRVKRSNEFIKSELDEIKGIGEKTKIKLFDKYKSLEKIKELSLKELSSQIGKDKAQKIVSFFNREK